MSKIWILTRVFLKNGSDTLLKTRKTKGIPKALTLLLLMGVLAMSMGVPLGMFVAEGYDMLEPMKQTGAILGLGLSLVSIAIFVFGIFYVLTTFYFSSDIENLLPLPVKPYQILSAKFATVLVYEYMTETVFLLPVIIAYGMKSGAGLVYYLYSLIVFLTLPVAPLVIASAINMVVMRFTNLGKHKDALRIVGGLLAMGFGIGINIFMQRNAANSGDPQQMYKMLMEGENSLVGISARFFPSAKIAAWALIGSTAINGLQNLLLFLVITAAFGAIFMVLAEILYLRGVMGASEAYSKRKNIGPAELDKNLVQSSAIRTYTLKELRLLFRTPSYFINCVLMNFLWPVFLLLPVISQPGILTELKNAKAYIENPAILGVIMAAGFAAGVFITGTTGITSTSISREGQNLYVGKYLPMRYRDQIMAKILSGIILNFIGVLVAVVTAIIIINPPVYVVLLVSVTAMLGVILMSFTGILIDLNFPKLNWDNEQKAVKQNFNLIINMLLGLLIAGLSVFMTIRFGLVLWQAFIWILAVAGAINIALYAVVRSYGEKLYKNIEA